MSSDSESTSNRRIPSLVQLCQRVASVHVESMCSLGEDASFELVHPILHNCSADALLRFEQATPSLAHDTSKLWKALCFRTFPLPAERRNSDSEPKSWREEFYVLRDLEAQRLEAVGSKLRIQREELEQRKKDSQIKFTDKLPPTKRYRGGWGQPQPPKTLIQKTRADAVKMHKGIYGARLVPAMPAAKTFRSLSSNTSNPKLFTAAASTLGSSSGKSGTRVTVSCVSKVQKASPATTSSSKDVTLSTNSTPSTPAGELPTQLPSTTVPLGSTTPSAPRPVQGSPPPNSARLKPPIARKDPMSSLFMPKHRAYSQLPTHSSSMRSRA